MIYRSDDHTKKGTPNIELKMNKKIIKDLRDAEIANYHSEKEQCQELTIDILIESFKASIE